MKLELRILVIDDDDMTRRVVSRELQRLGQTQVCTAGGATPALALLRGGEPFGLVLCDLEMPEGDGIEFLREFGALCPAAALILMSAVDPKVLRTAETLARNSDVRVLGSLSKPVDRSALGSLLDQLTRPAARGTADRRAHEPAPPTKDQLRKALQDGEFTIFVQPQLQIDSLELAGVEALVRWDRPGVGLIPPVVFLEACETAGLMDELTGVVVEKSIAALCQWRAQGLHTRVSVNFSASSLSRLAVPDLLASALCAHGLAPEQLIVELTETAVAGNLRHLLDVVTRLRLRGIHLSIDDFGTGYSSLAQLQSIPFSELKIDQCFVGRAHRDADARSIVESSARLGAKLGMTVVAEGIETLADLDLMRELGCHVAQGYFLSRPIPWCDLPQWVAARIPRFKKTG